MMLNRSTKRLASIFHRKYEKSYRVSMDQLRRFSDSMPTAKDHVANIRDQFTKQAAPFAEFYIHHKDDNLALIREGLKLRGNKEEIILDVGCGPGIVATFLSSYVSNVVGVDVTPAMLAEARNLAKEKNVSNIQYIEGLMENLPFEDRKFDGVVTRFTFHHLINPEKALKEMVRVCKPGGRIAVCDATPRPSSQNAYNAFERIRDPSHTKALTGDELLDLMKNHVSDCEVFPCRLTSNVKDLVDRAFPADGNEGRKMLIKLFEEDIMEDRMDMNVHRKDDSLFMSFPISVISGYRK